MAFVHSEDLNFVKSRQIRANAHQDSLVTILVEKDPVGEAEGVDGDLRLVLIQRLLLVALLPLAVLLSDGLLFRRSLILLLHLLLLLVELAHLGRAPAIIISI